MVDRTTVVLVDDHTLIREGLARSLGAEPDIDVLANVGTADAAGEACLAHKPQVLLSEIAIPGMLPLAEDVRAKMPETHVVFLSAVWHDRYIEQALAIYISVYLVDTILLYSYSAFGMPVSTTMTLVFELWVRRVLDIGEGLPDWAQLPK